MGFLSSIGRAFGNPPQVREADAALQSKDPKLQGESLVHNSDRPTDGNSFVLVGDVDALNRAWRAKMGMSS